MSDETIEAQVTFYYRNGDAEVAALMAKAREVDEEVGCAPEGLEYTLAQALQVVWHNDPHWLHQNFLWGWTLDQVCDDDERGWHDVWPLREHA